jgi:hypothetical protein
VIFVGIGQGQAQLKEIGWQIDLGPFNRAPLIVNRYYSYKLQSETYFLKVCFMGSGPFFHGAPVSKPLPIKLPGNHGDLLR